MSKRNWTPEEDYFLKQNYLIQSKKIILENLKNRTWKSIEHRIKFLGLYKNKKSKEAKRDIWLEEELLEIKKNYITETKEYFSNKLPNRTWKAIKDKANQLGLNKVKKSYRIKWSKEEDFLLLKIYLKSNKENIQINFPNRSFVAIQQRALFLGIIKDKFRKVSRNIWTPEEELLVKENYLSKTKEFFSEKLPNRTWRSILYKASELNLYKKEKNKDASRNPWTENELDILKNKYQHNSKDYILNLFPNRTWKAIREKAIFLNIIREKNLINQDAVKKVTETNLKNHGVKSTFQLESVKEKSRQTNLKNLGVEYAMSSKKVQKKSENTNLEKRGVINPFKSKEVQEKIRQTRLKNNSFQHSKAEEKFLILLRKIIDPEIIHHKEHPELKYIIDYYSPNYNIWIQFDGVYWHGKYTDKEKLKNNYFFNIKRSNVHQIYNTMCRDEIQNEKITNLIRFWEDDVKYAVKTNTVKDLIIKKFLEKNIIIEEEKSGLLF